MGTLADDLLSKTFLLAFRGRDGYDPVRAWLQAPLPDGRAFLFQASSVFSEQQVVEVAEGVHT